MATPEKQPYPLPAALRRTLAIAAAGLGFAIVFDMLLYGKTPGIAFPLYVLLLVLGMVTAARRAGTDLPLSAQVTVVPLIFFASMVAVRAGGLITFLNVVASLYLLALFAVLVWQPGIRRYRVADYMAPFGRLPSLLAHQFDGLPAALRPLGTGLRKHTTLVHVLRGLLIAAPVIAVFTLLFASADMVFMRYLEDFFDWNLTFDVTMVWRVIVAGGVGLAAAALLSYMTRRPPETPDALALAESTPGKAPGTVRSRFIEIMILFGSLNALFVSFLAVQLTYLFGGERNIAGAGFTYAEYARRGYFELIAVAVITFGLILVTERLLLRERGSHHRWFKIAAAALIVQVMVVMASAWNRLSLYEGAYGFTSLRLYSYIGLAWLAVIFCVLLYKIVCAAREHTFAWLTFISLVALLAGINAVNVDAFVARRNIERYHATGKLDVGYLVHLSDDAVTETAALLDSAPDPRLREALAGNLFQKRLVLQNKTRHWQSANATRAAALDALAKHHDFLEQYKDRRVEQLTTSETTR